jgi:hypothetical protein
MTRKSPKSISVLEFECQAPLRFFEHCARCPHFGNNCPDLAMGKEVLRGKKKIAYTDEPAENTIHVSAFNCLTPLYYFERSRKKCAHAGRCREEGLLLALLDGKKTLDYSHKEVIDLPKVRKRKVGKAAAAKAREAAF